MNTFTERGRELVKLHLWLLIMLGIFLLMFLNPVKNITFLWMLLAPANLIFKIKFTAPSKVIKSLSLLIGVGAILILILLWQPFIDNLFSTSDLLRDLSICFGLFVITIYFNGLEKLKPKKINKNM